VTTAPAIPELPARTLAVTLAVCERVYDKAELAALTLSPDTITYEADDVPAYEPFDAVESTLYDPSGVPAGDVTLSVTLDDPPGATLIVEPEWDAVQPAGTFDCKLKLLGEQPDPSLFETETV
jgi:hypothetical protein